MEVLEPPTERLAVQVVVVPRTAEPEERALQVREIMVEPLLLHVALVVEVVALEVPVAPAAGVVLSALYSGMEMGIYVLNKIRLDLRAESGSRPARLLRALPLATRQQQPVVHPRLPQPMRPPALPVGWPPSSIFSCTMMERPR